MPGDPEVVILSIPTGSQRGLVALSLLLQERQDLLRIDHFSFRVEAVLALSTSDRCFVLLSDPVAKVMAELPGPFPAAPAGNALQPQKRHRRRRKKKRPQRAEAAEASSGPEGPTMQVGATTMRSSAA
jgi:hypothetical protein